MRDTRKQRIGLAYDLTVVMISQWSKSSARSSQRAALRCCEDGGLDGMPHAARHWAAIKRLLRPDGLRRDTRDRCDADESKRREAHLSFSNQGICARRIREYTYEPGISR
eukprot:6205538-Pleurochrysis_carterae.AAC.8